MAGIKSRIALTKLVLSVELGLYVFSLLSLLSSRSLEHSLTLTPPFHFCIFLLICPTPNSGLTPLIFSGNSSQYFSHFLYPAYHTQGLHNPFYVMQYYTLLQLSHEPRGSSYLTTTVLSAGIKTYAVLTRDAFPDDSTTSAFCRKLKLGMAGHIAGVGFRGVLWCEEVGGVDGGGVGRDVGRV